MVNVNWPTAVVGEADIVSSVSASACHIGGPIGVNPGELVLVYGTWNQSQNRNLCVCQSKDKSQCPIHTFNYDITEKGTAYMICTLLYSIFSVIIGCRLEHK